MSKTSFSFLNFSVTYCRALPSFLSSSYETTVSELTTVGSVLINVTAAPETPGNTLTYNIFSHPPSIFNINTSTGSVVLVGSLDYEQETSHSFNVEVMEDFGAVMTPVTIYVENANDEVPLCLPVLYTVTIPEGSVLGSELLRLSCSDSDGDELEFSLEGETASLFELTRVDTATASLSLTGSVNSDTLSTHTLLVSVHDGLHTAEVTIYCYVEPSNDHVPTFNQTVYDCSVSESSPVGSVLCSVLAEDGDTGVDGEITYSVTGGNDDNKFGIDSSTGQIVLVGTIDYESVQGYLIIIRATDNGDPSFGNFVQVRITVADSNDNAPTISPLMTAVVAENSPLGSVVTPLHCSDADSGSNGDIQLSIGSQTNTQGESVAVFSIEASTNNLTTISAIDYEENLFYTISLSCSDYGSPSLTSSSTLIVSVTPLNEFAPVISEANYSVTVAENSTVGTSVLQVTAYDSDGGLDGAVLFSIESDERDFLQISEKLGHITTRELLDCKWGLEHMFIISAADEGVPSLSSQSQLTVRLNGCNLGQLTPQETIYFASVAENSVVGTEVVSVACNAGSQEHGAPQYSIMSPSLTPFQIDSETGQISLHSPPDYEQATSHMLQVKCIDPSDIESYSTFSVYATVVPENEHTPEFPLAVYGAELSEDALPGSSLLSLLAEDGDLGIDGSILYSIQEDTHDFIINQRTGVVYNTAFLDREEESLHLFHVVAMDQLGEGESVRSSVAEVRVSITDSNDNAPECSKAVYYISISPLLSAGETVLTLECTDADIGVNSKLHYNLLSHSSDTLGLFEVTEDTGELVLAQKLTSESATVHEMTVTVEDSGELAQSSVVLVVLDLESSVAGEGVAVDDEGSSNTAVFIMRDMSLEIVSLTLNISKGQLRNGLFVSHAKTTMCFSLFLSGVIEAGNHFRKQ